MWWDVAWIEGLCMARVVGVHGVGQQLRGEESLLRDWRPALADGVHRAGGPVLRADDLAMAFYGDLFRTPGSTLAVGDPVFTAADVEDGFEQELLFAWWEAAAESDEKVAPAGADTLARTPRSVQAALRALSNSTFFSNLALRSLVFDLKQVRLYLTDDRLRKEAVQRVTALIDEDTRVLIAHSLGTVVAYEALCTLAAEGGHGVRALVTLGSPLSIPMIYDRLRPEPGAWPGPAALAWTNVADHGDVVALVKDLRPRFGPEVVNEVVHNGSRAHDATAYLTEIRTGTAVSDGLRGG